jgi:uncharacterized protein YneF (UPF0154 family)
MKLFEWILKIIVAMVWLVISLIAGLLTGIALGFIAWNAGINYLNRILEKRLR